MSFMSFQTEAYAGNVSGGDVAPSNLIEKGSQIQRSCFRTVVSWLAPYRGPKVRRPMSGIELKQESHAHIYLLQEDGTPAKDLLYNSVGDVATRHGREIKSEYFTDFTLQGVRESRVERAQVIETFGETFLFLYGERPRTIECTGLLMNTHDFNWRAEWWENYEHFLRGTRCAERRVRAYLTWDDIVVEGYILKSDVQEQSGSQHQVKFNFTMLLTNYVSIASQLFSVWSAAAIEAATGTRHLSAFSEENFGSSMTENSDEYIGSLQDDIKSITTGRAIIVSQDMREWLMANPEEIFAQIDPRIAGIIQWATDPKGAALESFGSPLKALDTVNQIAPAGLIPNEICLAAIAAEDLMRLAQDPFGGMIAAMSAATPFIEQGLDGAELLTKDFLGDLFGTGGGETDMLTKVG